MHNLDKETRLKNGFPVTKLGSEHFTAYWDAAFVISHALQFQNIKFSVRPDNLANAEIGESDVIMQVSFRCNCGCERNGEVARHMTKPARFIKPDDRMIGLSFGYSVDGLVRLLKASGCTCLKESDADAVFHFFDSGEYKSVVLTEPTMSGGSMDLNHVNPDHLMAIFKSIH